MPFSPSMKQMADCAAMTPSRPFEGLAAGGGGATDTATTRQGPSGTVPGWLRDPVGRFIPLAVALQATGWQGCRDADPLRSMGNRQVACAARPRRGGVRLRAPGPVGGAAGEHAGGV